MEIITNFFKVAGGYFPFVLPFIAIYSGFPNLFIPLILDYVIINPILKRLVSKVGLQTKRPICNDLSSYNCFGMPSGHTEIHWIFLTYMMWYYYDNGFKSNKDIVIFSLIVLMTMVVMWQRWVTGLHTIGQIFGGIITGVIIGSTLYHKLQNE